MKLSKEQEKWLLDNFKDESNLNILTQKLFENENIDGRSREGRLVRSFLQERGLEYETSSFEKVGKVELSEGSKEFIENQFLDGSTSLHIAKILFPEIKNLSPLHKESRAVLAHIKEIDKNNEINKEVDRDYSPPQATSRVIKKINDATGSSLNESSLTKKQEMLIDQLQRNLNRSRFVLNMNSIRDIDERNLFENEFVSATWEKEDLSADEVTLYINLCKEVLNLEQCSKHTEKLKEMFEEATSSAKDEDQRKISMTLSDAIKTKADEYDKIEKRIESLIKKLQGDRTKRIEERQRGASSIIALVEAFQNEESRDHMLRMAEIEKKSVKKEVERIENMDTFKARVLGIKKSDAV